METHLEEGAFFMCVGGGGCVGAVFCVKISPEDSLGSSVTRALNARTIRETETGHHFRFYFACLSVSLYFACFHF